MLRSIAVILFILLSTPALHAQEAIADSSSNLRISAKYIDAVAAKAKSIEEKLDKKTAKALAQLKKQEEKIINKLKKTDSLAAKHMMENAAVRYKELEEKLKNPGKLQQYIPQIDSLGTSLHFLTQNSPILGTAKEVQDKLKDAIGKTDALKTQLQKAENLKQFLKERKEFLKQQLEKFGLTKQLKQLNKQVYYYGQQLNEYKQILNDPKKIEKKALELLSRTKIWKEFFRKNSMLASLFRLPGDDLPLTPSGGGMR